jgi:hypothetical protein
MLSSFRDLLQVSDFIDIPQVIKKIAMFFSMCVPIVKIVCVLFLNDQV